MLTATKMLARPILPGEAYRRVELDARIEGVDGAGLTRMLLESALAELDRASRAFDQGNRSAKVTALTRAASSISGLHQGIAADNPMREALAHLYSSGEAATRAAITVYDQNTIDRVRSDLHDILGLL